jgi:hypothetical protein
MGIIAPPGRHRLLLASRFDLDPVDPAALEDPEHLADIAAAADPAPGALTDRQVAELVAFLHALSGDGAQDLGHLVPGRVLSGLPLADRFSTAVVGACSAAPNLFAANESSIMPVFSSTDGCPSKPARRRQVSKLRRNAR